MTLLVTETTGALSPTFDRALRALGNYKHARTPTTHDTTRYGLSRSSPRTFLALSPSRGYLGGRRSHGRNYHISRRT